MTNRVKRIMRAGLMVLCVAALMCVNILVYATSSAELEQKTQDLQKELKGLNKDLNSVVADLEKLTDEAENLADQIVEAEEEYEKIQKQGEEQYKAMKLRIKYMYEAGNTSFLEMLLTADNMSDFLNKSEFIQNVSEYDRNMLNELLDTQDKLEKESEKLQKRQKELSSKQKELKAKRKEVEKMIKSTSAELSDYTEQLARAKEAEAEAAAQAEAERAAAAAAAAREAAERAAAEEEAEKAAAAREEAERLEREAEEARQAAESSDDVPEAEYTYESSEGKELIGTFTVTHYCSCRKCCGKWAGARTASGTVPTPGRTIAVDPSVIPMGSRVIINGMVYVAEDTGSAIKGKRIDIFVKNHGTALALGVYDADVYWAD